MTYIGPGMPFKYGPINAPSAAFVNPIGTALAFAYDAIDGLSAYGAGASITTWADQSGNARDLVQDGANPLPTRGTLNSYPCANFNALSTRLASAAFGPVAQPNTIFTVLQSSYNGGQQDFFDGTGVNRHLIFAAITTANLGFFAGTAQSGTVTLNNAAALLLITQFNGASSSMWLTSGAAIKTGNTGAQGLGRIYLGTNNAGTNRLIGNVQGVYGYNSALSLADINTIAAYLGGRYGVSVATFS